MRVREAKIWVIGGEGCRRWMIGLIEKQFFVYNEYLKVFHSNAKVSSGTFKIDLYLVLSIALCVLQQLQKELGALLGPTSLGSLPCLSLKSFHSRWGLSTNIVSQINRSENSSSNSLDEYMESIVKHEVMKAYWTWGSKPEFSHISILADRAHGHISLPEYLAKIQFNTGISNKPGHNDQLHRCIFWMEHIHS